MILKKTFGQLVSGEYCSTDSAFDRLQREFGRLYRTQTWNWFFQRVESLEGKLHEAGGFDPKLFDTIEKVSSFFGRKEDVDRYFETVEILYDIEDCAAAFFVTLQTLLNAIKVAVKRVYTEGQSDLGQQAPIEPPGLFSDEFNNVWQISNYVKHNAEWGVQLNGRQKPSFEVLKALGTASDDLEARFATPWVVAASACSLAHCDTPSRALRAVISRCQDSRPKLEETIQRDFAPFEEEIKNARRCGAAVNASTKTDP
jgi:hypothetical protein